MQIRRSYANTTTLKTLTFEQLLLVVAVGGPDDDDDDDVSFRCVSLSRSVGGCDLLMPSVHWEPLIRSGVLCHFEDCCSERATRIPYDSQLNIKRLISLAILRDRCDDAQTTHSVPHVAMLHLGHQ